MATVVNSISSDQALILTILKALATCGSDARMLVRAGVLSVDGEPIVVKSSHVSAEGFEAQVGLLSRQLGLADIDSDELVRRWLTALKSDGPVHKSKLLELAKTGQFVQTDNTLGKWQQALKDRFSKTPFSSCVAEHDTASASSADSTLELSAMLGDWPQRLLTHRDWAFADAPLPGMSPMSLDDVWVDIQFIDPLEFGQAKLGEDLLQSLETRYEERRWLAEPAQFVLERLYQSTALIGAPGIGKTTFLKWVARQLINNPDGRFLLPLFVPLRKYALLKQNDPNLDLVSFAIRQCGVSDANQVELWANALSYLSGTSRETVLFLLDGWDEVPADNRETLLIELQNLTHGFTSIITSRPSAYPLALPADKVYEITELPPDAIPTLVRRWFASAGRAQEATALLEHLDAHPDLRGLARNPFLLTLLCGIRYGAEQDAALPTSRTELYQQAVNRITAHHSQRYPGHPFTEARRRHVERLALWLIADAPGAPQYVFDSGDVQSCCDDAELLDEVLLRSRLISQWDFDKESLHFLHTTFQEFLAACSLVREQAADLSQLLATHAFDAGWQEVFRFVAGRSETVRDVFWRVMAHVAASPDRFGLVFVRLARFLREAGVIDGGQQLLGLDVREVLWSRVVKNIEANVFVDACVELDVTWYVERCRKHLSEVQSELLQAQLLRSLGRIRTAESSDLLLQQILSGNEKDTAVASYAIQEVLSADGVNTLRDALGDASRPPHVRRGIIRALGFARDAEVVRALADIAQTDATLAADALRALAHIGGADACAVLDELLSVAAGAEHKRQIIDALGEVREPAARDRLLLELTLCDPIDPLVEAILSALCENPITRGSAVLSDYLHNNESEEVREAAAWALVDSVETGVTEALGQAARQDASQKVRTAALAALRKQARPADAAWLADCVRDDNRSLIERTNALEALLWLASRYARRPDGPWLQKLATELTLLALSDPSGELTHTAADRAYLAGEQIGQRLVDIVDDATFPASAREAVCGSLGKLKHQDASNVLLKLLRRQPDTAGDEATTVTDADQRIARAAAEALSRIDPGLLLHEPGLAAETALARFAVETGSFMFSDSIIDARGLAIVGEATPKPYIEQAGTNVTPPVDFVIVTALEEERVAILERLPNPQRLAPTDDDIRIYHGTELPVTFSDGSPTAYSVVVVSLLNMGRVDAAVATSDAIRRWQPRYVLLVGIAGGVASRGVGVGDILISDQIVDYELQKVKEADKPEFRWQVHRADPRLLGAAKTLSPEDCLELVKAKRPRKGVPKRHVGPIATGDKVIASEQLLKDLGGVWTKLIGVEMEAGGAAAAAFQAAQAPGFFMIRGVSDLADARKGTPRVDKWRQYACELAASFAVTLLQNGPVPQNASAHRQDVDIFQQARPNSNALSIWQEKLAFLRQEEATTSNAAQKFELRKQIEECQAKIQELYGG
jgi:nucleoside phosphorylase